MLGWLRRWRTRSNCFHHHRRSGVSWIKEQLVDLGRRKMLWCTRCGKVWIF